MKKEYIITSKNRLSLRDIIAEECENFAKKYIKERKERLRYRLTVEECLIAWLTEDSIGKTLTVTAEKKFLIAPTFKIDINCHRINPYNNEDIAYKSFAAGILRAIGLSPAYHYDDGVSTLQFSLPERANSKVFVLLGVLIVALFIGLTGKLFVSQSILQEIDNIILTPLYDLFLNLLSLVAGPLVFLSVAWGIYGIGDTISLSKIGKSTIFIFLRNTFLATVAGLAVVPFFNLTFTNKAVGTSQFAEITEMIFGCVPKNIIEPFSSGNTLQIIFLAVAIGISLLFLGKKTHGVARAIEQINILLQHMMGFIGKLVPFLVFVIVVQMIWNGDYKVALSSWKFIVILLLGCIAIITVFTAIVSVRYKINPFKFVKKVLPTVIVAVLTASSAATFESTVSICNEKLGIAPAVTSFGVPLGMVMHNPIAAFNNLLVVLFFAESFGVECSMAWIVVAVFCAAMLAIASPPIPGGGVIVYTMLFLQLGIPVDALAIITAIEMVTDFIITSAEMFCLFPGVLSAAKSVNKLDLNVLRK